MPRTDKLAKIAVANRVSIHWLATGEGEESYDPGNQARYDDATRATYLQDAAAAAKLADHVVDLVPRLQQAQVTLDSVAAAVGFRVPSEWFVLLLGLLADEQLTELGSRRVLEYLKAAVPPS